MAQDVNRPFRRLAVLSIACVLGLIFLASRTMYARTMYVAPPGPLHSMKVSESTPATQNALIAQYFIDYPVPTSEFGEMGRRIQLLTSWMNEVPATFPPSNYTLLLESLASTLFPFIQNPLSGQNLTLPFQHLRNSYVKGSRGIVIPTGTDTFRFAGHLILNLREVLKSTLPMQIIYAGDEDLPRPYREALLSLSPKNIEFVNIWEVLDDTTMGIKEGKWAIKPFAMLASTFEEVILADADAIFLQKPEVILDSHKAYRETGVLFFHDRLVLKGEYEGRHEWWRHQMRHHRPSSTFEKSITMRDGYGQEADSGVVVMNKQRLEVVMGLLHACWQNSKTVREKETYTHTHGDKETYWLGMELSGVPYSFAENYGAALGKLMNESVLSSTIAHVDEVKQLLWFNGSLLKNKGGNVTEYLIPDRLMMGGDWTFTQGEEFIARIDNAEPKELLSKQTEIIRGIRGVCD